MDDCVFCRISRGEVSVKKIYENDNFFSFPDANPKAKGHSLVIPKKHYKTTLDLPVGLGQELIDCIKNTATILMKTHKAGGFNIFNNNFSVAGQVVHHAHYHILPRKEGDGLSVLS